MRIVEEKLDEFYKDIMNDVNENKKNILDLVDKDIQKKLEEKELEYLEKAYSRIQEGLKGIHREKNEIISRAAMESKRKLLNKREEIINQVYEMVLKKLNNFVDSNEYEEYFLENINNLLVSSDSSDEIEIIIIKKDQDKIEKIKQIRNCSITIDNDDLMIGGFKSYNKTRNVYNDESLYSKLEEHRDKIYEMCSIDIG